MKKLLIITLCLVMLVAFVPNVFALVVEDPGYNEGTVSNAIKEKMGYIWATIATIVQLAAVACVVFAGLRYMFASSDQKADIKQGMIYLVIGAILVFGAISIIRLVGNAAISIMPQ